MKRGRFADVLLRHCWIGGTGLPDRASTLFHPEHRRQLEAAQGAGALQAAFESVEPNVALWWEDKGRKEMRPDNVPMLDMMPEPLKEQILEQHADTIKRAAAQLAGGLVLRQDGNLKPNEATAIDDEIDVLRQHLIDHGIDTDSFEKLFT